LQNSLTEQKNEMNSFATDYFAHLCGSYKAGTLFLTWHSPGMRQVGKSYKSKKITVQTNDMTTDRIS
jgi:hypothetical protein